MRRKSKRQWVEYIEIAMVAASVSLLFSMEGIAAEGTTVISAATSGNDTMSTDAEYRSRVSFGDTVGSTGTAVGEDDNGFEKADDDILSVELPVVTEGEKSPFDFILDPCGLLYETNAMRYGGGAVEEGATMIFRNEEGEYDFSRYSDKLSITNQSGEPVIVTISASVSDLEEIDLIGCNDFSGNENPAIYLAMIDDQGNELPISEDGETLIRMELGSGVYFFGLTGACNPDTDWQKVYVYPKVTVTWHVESVPTEAEEGTDSLPDGDITEQDPVQENLQKPSVDDTIPTDRKTDEMTESDGSDGEAEVSDYPDGEDSAYDKDNSSDVSGNLIPPDGEESDILESHESGEDKENSSGDSGTEADMNDTEKSVSVDESTDMDGK